ncbi:uncharacterized protein LOC122248048 [Penaeus japonicus]|uniref:uncharacterized protein LOC122248048 n=1 Tax=Penaeus japonicus TaxID=27405 RepID=UPI001C715551|nr:uncharacterized protein LOC122248048 [Penaeus japonicus]
MVLWYHNILLHERRGVRPLVPVIAPLSRPKEDWGEQEGGSACSRTAEQHNDNAAAKTVPKGTRTTATSLNVFLCSRLGLDCCSPDVRTLLRRSWVRLRERRAPRGGGPRGSMAGRSRSFSTMHTTLIDPAPLAPLNPRNPSVGSLVLGACQDAEGHFQGLGGSSGSVAPLVEGCPGGGAHRSARSDASAASQTSILAEEARARSGAPGAEEKNGKNNGSCIPGGPREGGGRAEGAGDGGEGEGGAREPVVMFSKDAASVDICANGRLKVIAKDQ